MARNVTKSKGDEEEVSPFDNIDTEIERKGREIVLPGEPQEMTYDEAIKALRRKQKEEETEVNIHEQVDAFPWDGARAFMLAMKERYGWTSAVPRKTFFGKIQPTVIAVQCGPRVNDTVQVIWGDFELPNVEGVIRTEWGEKDGRPCFQVGGSVKRKHHGEIHELIALTREFVQSHSIYKGKPIRLRCDSDGYLDDDLPPVFINTEGVRPEELIFTEDTQSLVETNVMTPIKKTAQCEKFQIPLSRGILLEGPFGVGKTLLASVVAKICQENNWTFFMIDQVSALKTAVDFARLYGPAVVFAEDIDRVLRGERSADMDAILNTIDGVQSKSDKIITILTTNEVEKIHQSMLRPGRLDAVISIRPPDAAAAEKLIRVYARNLIEDGTDLKAAGKSLENQIPAVIREVVERSKLAALSRLTEEGDPEEIRLIDTDLSHEAVGMQQHLALLNRDRNVEPSAEEAVGISMRNLIGGMGPEVTKTLERASSLVSSVNSRVRNVQSSTENISNMASSLHEKADEIGKLSKSTDKGVKEIKRYIR